MTAIRPLDLDALTLESGGHADEQNAFCIMEAVAWIAGEPWSDAPQCTSPVIGAFLRSWNDSLNDEDRNRLLKPLIPRLIGTRTTAADEETRAWMATDWLVRVQAPAWLELAGLTERANELRNLPPLTSSEIAVAVRSVVEHARDDAAAAWDAARDAAGAAARDAAGAAAWAAAWAAARDAARDAAGDAARDAAGAAAWAAAWAAAGAAARDAAWDAAGAAARDAAWAKLRPTVETLQLSALDLVERMIAVGKVAA